LPNEAIEPVEYTLVAMGDCVMNRILQAADEHYRLKLCVLMVLATSAMAAFQAGF
jgi:hypothetical protein